MSSANNAVGAMAAYFVQGTAATNVSNVTNARDTSKTASSSFDMVLNKVSDSLVQSKTTDVSKQANQSLNNAKQTNTSEVTAKASKIDNSAQTDTKADLQEVEVLSDSVRSDGGFGHTGV